MRNISWIWIVVLSLLVFSLYWRYFSGAPAPEWMQCKESLLVQVFSGKCTPSQLAE